MNVVDYLQKANLLHWPAVSEFGRLKVKHVLDSEAVLIRMSSRYSRKGNRNNPYAQDVFGSTLISVEDILIVDDRTVSQMKK